MKTAVNNKTKNLVLMSLFAAIISACAWLTIPATVPFTMQTFGVFLALGVLGGKRGTISVCIYLLLGIIGIPVFSAGKSGIGVLLGSTGGYLIALIFSGLVVWGMEVLLGKKTWVLALSMVLGLLVCYAIGTFWFITVYTSQSGEIGLWSALSMCVFPFIIPDLIKIVLALVLQKRLAPLVK